MLEEASLSSRAVDVHLFSQAAAMLYPRIDSLGSR